MEFNKKTLESLKTISYDEFADDERLIFKLQTLFPKMSKNSKKISSFIMDYPENFLKMSITQLSNKIGISPSAITRYCQNLGYSGLNEFKFHLEDSLKDQNLLNIDTSDNISSLKVKIGNNYKKIFNEIVTKLDNKSLDKASDLILSADKIFLFGHGGSNYIAQITQMLLMQIGISCYAFVDPPLASTASSLLKSGDVAIGLSSSGKSIIAVDALKKAHENGAKTIAITCDPNSILASNSDVSLCYLYDTRDDLRYFHILKLAELAVVGTLQCVVLQKSMNQLGERLGVYKDSFFGRNYVY